MVWELPGLYFGGFGGSLGPLLGASWALGGRLLGTLGRVLGVSWAPLGSLGRLLGDLPWMSPPFILGMVIFIDAWLGEVL